MTQPDPLNELDRRERSDERAEDWHLLADPDYCAAQGLPPVPELTPEQERRMWWRIAWKIAERRDAEDGL